MSDFSVAVGAGFEDLLAFAGEEATYAPKAGGSHAVTVVPAKVDHREAAALNIIIGATTQAFLLRLPTGVVPDREDLITLTVSGRIFRVAPLAPDLPVWRWSEPDQGIARVWAERTV